MGQLIYMVVRLVAGTLYPAYRSFKAVKTKNVKVSQQQCGWSHFSPVDDLQVPN